MKLFKKVNTLELDEYNLNLKINTIPTDVAKQILHKGISEAIGFTTSTKFAYIISRLEYLICQSFEENSIYYRF